MRISFFHYWFEIWCSTDMEVHLFCHLLLYFFVFLTEFAQQNLWVLLAVNSTLWKRRRHDLCPILHSKFGISRSTPEIPLPLGWRASTSKLVPSPLRNPPSLSQLSSCWTNFFQPPPWSGIFFPVPWFYKGISQAGSKIFRQPHHRVKLSPVLIWNTH